MSKKQTAVDWLLNNMPDLGRYIPFGVSMELHAKFQQAKEMEKEQMIDIAYKQIENCHTEMGEIKYSKVPEELLKETYGE